NLLRQMTSALPSPLTSPMPLTSQFVSAIAGSNAALAVRPSISQPIFCPVDALRQNTSLVPPLSKSAAGPRLMRNITPHPDGPPLGVVPYRWPPLRVSPESGAPSVLLNECSSVTSPLAVT